MIRKLTQLQVAELLDVTDRTIRRWHCADRTLPRNDDGTYDAKAVVRWFTGSCVLESSRQRVRVLRYQADRLAMENDTRRHKLVKRGVILRPPGR